jgi:hypothetical protein
VVKIIPQNPQQTGFDMNPVVTALENAFGPATVGIPDVYADTERTNPYRTFAYAGPTADVAIEGLVKSVAERRKGGSLIFRVEPAIGAMEDGRIMVRARLTFADGLIGTETDEARLPHNVI